VAGLPYASLSASSLNSRRTAIAPLVDLSVTINGDKGHRRDLDETRLIVSYTLPLW